MKEPKKSSLSQTIYNKKAPQAGLFNQLGL
jgi:hypothetical protein